MLINSPIFIVGPPRSGTTLLAAMLANHSRIACGPETHFFSKLSLKELQAAVSDREWPKKAVNQLASLHLSGQLVHQLFGLPLTELDQYLQHRSPNIQSMLEALVQAHAQSLGKPRWAEKTPNHLLYIDLIRQLFPDASVIRIIRDPRDVALSLRKLPWASQSILANAYLWQSWIDQSQSFFLADNNTLTLRYEDLISDPKEIMCQVCRFIGEKFEEEMVDTTRAARTVTSPGEPWKSQVFQEIDLSRRYVWRKELPYKLETPINLICFEGLNQFDYEATQKPQKTIRLRIFNRRMIEKNESLILRASKHNLRILFFENDTAFEQEWVKRSLDACSMIYLKIYLAVKAISSAMIYWRSNSNLQVGSVKRKLFSNE